MTFCNELFKFLHFPSKFKVILNPSHWRVAYYGTCHLQRPVLYINAACNNYHDYRSEITFHDEIFILEKVQMHSRQVVLEDMPCSSHAYSQCGNRLKP